MNNYTHELIDVLGNAIIEDDSDYGACYADYASESIARITVNNIKGDARYAVNITYNDYETGRPCRTAHHIYLTDLIRFYDNPYVNATASKRFRDSRELIMDFMKSFLYNNVFCTKHTGKMTGINSCSTSAACNARCKARAEKAKDGCICKECFALQQMSYQKSTNLKYARNTELLTSIKLYWYMIPLADSNDVFRFESFGDLNNEQQFANYCTIAETRRHITHTLWTKNPDIIESACKHGAHIPDNMIIIYSSPWVNHVSKGIEARYPFIEKVFTVWTSEEEASKAGYSINCAKRSCNTCRRCYTHGIDRIHELLK